MFYVFILLPVLLIIGFTIFGVIVYKKDRNKYFAKLAEQEAANKLNKPIDAVSDALTNHKRAAEYVISNYHVQRKGIIDIDVIYISFSGIYVIKAMSFANEVVGSSEDEYFIEKKDGTELVIKNPLFMNKDGINLIRNLTNQTDNVINLTLITNGDLSSINTKHHEINYLNDFVGGLKKKDVVFSDTDLTEFYNNIINYRDADED